MDEENRFFALCGDYYYFLIVVVPLCGRSGGSLSSF